MHESLALRYQWQSWAEETPIAIFRAAEACLEHSREWARSSDLESEGECEEVEGLPDEDLGGHRLLRCEDQGFTQREEQGQGGFRTQTKEDEAGGAGEDWWRAVHAAGGRAEHRDRAD